MTSAVKVQCEMLKSHCGFTLCMHFVFHVVLETRTPKKYQMHCNNRQTCYSFLSGGTSMAVGLILMITSYLVFNSSLALRTKEEGEWRCMHKIYCG